MPKYTTTAEELTSIANAIRAKTGGSSELVFPTGFVSAINSISANGTDTSDANATASDILYNKTAYVNGSKIIGNIQTKTSSDLTASGLTVTTPAGYYAQSATKTLTDANLIAGNIKNGTSIFGITGTYITPPECPTFTFSFTDNWTTLNVTCDKTYSECVNYTSSNNGVWYARIIWTDGNTLTQKLSGAIFHDNTVENSPYYCYVEVRQPGIATFKVTYTSDGNITWESDPIELIECPIFTLTQNNNTFSVTCNKTFSDCINYTYSGIVMADVRLEGAHIPFACINEPTNDTIVYSISMIDDTYGIQVMKITYTSSGTLNYEESMINKQDSSTLTASGATVTAPAGYYPAAATKTIASGSATTPATSITANPSITVGSDGLITATASATQNVTPTVSAGYISSGTAGTITVSGSNTNQLSTQAGTTITPTESEQTAVAAGKYTTGAVKVGAISSTYVGSGITSRSSSDLTTSGATVTVPAGYYSAQASKAVANGSAAGPATISGTSATISTGTNTLTLTKTVSVTPTVSAGYVSSGTATNSSVSLTASVTTKAAATITPTTTNQTIASGTYLTGTQTISGDSNLVASNIISGKSIFGVSGSVVIQHYYTGSSAPSSSTGVDGDIYLKTS